MPIRLDRAEEIARFYERHAQRLHRTITAKTFGLDTAMTRARLRGRSFSSAPTSTSITTMRTGGCTESPSARLGGSGVGSIASSPGAG
jgi:hypothetical protein